MWHLTFLHSLVFDCFHCILIRVGEDHDALQNALEFVRELADYINDHKHDADNVKDLFEIENKFDDFDGSLAGEPKRRFYALFF